MAYASSKLACGDARNSWILLPVKRDCRRRVLIVPGLGVFHTKTPTRRADGRTICNRNQTGLVGIILLIPRIPPPCYLDDQTYHTEPFPSQI